MSKNDWGRYPDDFCRELGRFAFVFADVEGVAGELIVFDNRPSEKMKGHWSRSGEQLISALRLCFERPDFQQLCDDLEKLTIDRNLFMHGEWSFHSDGLAMVMKRHHSKETQTPGYQMAQVTVEHLSTQTKHLRRIEKALGDYLSEKMGIL